MSGCGFFNDIVHRIDQWMGDLFIGKRLAPTELTNMDFAELKYWHDWWDAEFKERKRQEAELAEKVK